MRKFLTGLGAGLVCLATLATTAPARALMVAPAPMPQRVVTADCVFVGKVTAVEDSTVEASPFPNNPKVHYKVAVVKVTDAVTGTKGLTSIRVGFIAPMEEPKVQPVDPKDGGVRPVIRPIRRFPQVNLAAGQEALFFLKKHHDQDFYIAPMYYDVVNKENNENFAKDLETLKKSAKLMEKPEAGLKSKNADERFLTAALLVMKYRTFNQVGGAPKLEPIDAEQSKLILQALADADWSNRQDRTQLSPQQTFFTLGLQPQDGWKPVAFKTPEELADAAKKWLKENAGTYRVQRFVAQEKDK